MNNVQTDVKYVIWSNIDPDVDEWRDAYAEFLEDNGYDDDPDDEYAIYQHMIEVNSLYLDDERLNLDIDISRPIVAIADLGLWNGRFSGYKELNSCNIKDCLNGFDSCEYHEWYVDANGDLRCTAIHHDGRNYILYRAYRDGITDEQIEGFLTKLYYGDATQKDIEAVTCRIGDVVASIYGWELSV